MGSRVNSGMGAFDWGPLATKCPVCRVKDGLLVCGGCKVVHYCGAAHQADHRPTHKSACVAIKKTRAKLEQEEATLRANPGDNFSMPADVFNNGVGEFWGILDTRDYMRARFAAADALLQVQTVSAVEKALAHFTDMLRLCRSDNLSVRDIVPGLLLRLGREQECYDFIKWWATIDDEDHYNGDYDWGDNKLPYLDLRGEDAFEAIDKVATGSLSHVVILTLLKLRLILDLERFENGLNEWDRPLGSLVQKRLRSRNRFAISTKELQNQYQKLLRIVHNRNPHFWEMLVNDETPVMPQVYSRGSVEEAHVALYQCLSAWEESEDAIIMLDADTVQLVTRPAPSPDIGDGDGDSLWAGLENLKITKPQSATEYAFPFIFQAPIPTIGPADLFPPTRIGPNQIVRFVCRTDPSMALAYADGACLNNGQPEPRGGWAVVLAPPANGGVLSGRLEDSQDNAATSNRAELRAAVAALRLRNWEGLGLKRIVIATDSTYIVNGATKWAKTWVTNGWKTRAGADAKNKDLWELLLSEVGKCKDNGLRVDLWSIGRALNSDADAAAKQAASTEVTSITESLPSDVISNTDPYILALCFDFEELFDDSFKRLASKLTAKAKMVRATTPNAALAQLKQQPLPSIILVGDGAITREKKVRERVIELLRDGVTVVLAGFFSSMVSEGQFNRLFAEIGLPWVRGSYTREDVSLRRDVVGSRLASRLPSSHSQKALFAKNVAPSAAWYAMDSGQAAFAFAKVGAGHLGYIGDVNGVESSDTVVLAMCGLLG
ncbi:hypothetical protein B0T24DRAFT_641736 [Lasiosphaeria ovina]|uniref:ribonuclease H n=1 Tax=Lasiosphaeria ovina TaxID=92902 RepID=A0AAE0MYD3_9PEZI|nr:hypothetical protein B0T24DRAFT_641736 [Lasiosphaeria ovina]